MLEAVTYFDPRKMFDSQGKFLQIQDMPFAERMALAAYAIVEAFKRGKKATGLEEAVQIGVRRKVKFVDRFKFAVIYGKMMGYISDEPPEDLRKANRSLHVVFVSPQGNKMQVNVGPDGKRKLVETNERVAEMVQAETPHDNIAKQAGVQFVRSTPQ